MKVKAGIVAMGAALALAVSAEAAGVSQRDQQKAAQRAYEASAESYNDAARGFQQFKDAATGVRDAAKGILKEAGKELLKRGK